MFHAVVRVAYNPEKSLKTLHHLNKILKMYLSVGSKKIKRRWESLEERFARNKELKYSMQVKQCCAEMQ